MGRIVKVMRTMHQIFGEQLMKYAEEDPDIFVVEADLMRAGNTEQFFKRYPERSLNAGVAEANMAGIAAGLAAVGKKPFIQSFTPFVSRRILDQVYISIAYAQLPVRIIGTCPGVTPGVNGGTHMSFEDVAIYRSIPNMVVFEPADGKTLERAFKQIVNTQTPLYMRLDTRESAEFLSDDQDIQLGKAIKLRDGADVSIIASGFLVREALEAAKILKKDKISVDVIYVHTIKPLDKKMIIDSAKKTKAVVVAENHSVYGGLGDAVLDALRNTYPVFLEKVGVEDRFGEVGTVHFLKEKFGLTGRKIIDAVKKVKVISE